MSGPLTALNRFGLGARIGEADGLRDPRGWLMEQLGRPPLLAEDGLTELEQAGEMVSRLRRAQQARDREAIGLARRAVVDAMTREALAVLIARIRTDSPFVERLVAFWSNHLCVSVRERLAVQALAGHYERTVVRPHVLGRFEDMVLASARHPAMLLYLDNARSIGPGSRVAKEASAKRDRQVGLNENYARELLELHTVGVDGGYAQADVEALAKIFTGWTIDGQRRSESTTLEFVYRRGLHEPGGKRVMGTRYRRAGEDEGRQVIRDLCRHPATARFLAGKLARHFVADEPPESAVNRLAEAFEDTGGDLLAVSRTLVDLEEAWSHDNRKFRTPQEWVVAAFRAVGAEEAPARLLAVLGQLRHPMWAPAAPKGYDDVMSPWADPDSLMNRAELARTLAGQVARSGLDPERLAEVVDARDEGVLEGLLKDGSIRPRDRIALAFAGPAFQWR